MERYRDQELGDRPRIAVLVWDKLGNFIIATIVLQALRRRFPNATIDYYGGERTREFEEASDLIDARFTLVGFPGGLTAFATFVADRVKANGPYDLGVNLDFEPVFAAVLGMIGPRFVAGPSCEQSLRQMVPPAADRQQQLDDDPDWNRFGFASEYADLVSSQYLGELWCRRVGLSAEGISPRVPVADPGSAVPDVILATGGTRSTKFWPVEYWIALAQRLLGDGLTVGLVGVARARQAAEYGAVPDDDDRLIQAGVADLRGLWTLPRVAGALRRARLTITIDNAIGHLAAAVGTSTVTLWGGSPWRLWSARSPSARHIRPSEICLLCEEARFKNVACLRERKICMESISPGRVYREASAALKPAALA
ncbi:MAG: hypothetical protein EPO26_03345 [Chloroflexota bacterium]|nr:MAG: hypothetical protein EPO26_03345 [Chloroflexota bacterium]